MKIKTLVIITVPILLVYYAIQGCSSLTLTSPAFKDKEIFPEQFTCDGEGISPPLSWRHVPKDTKSLVLIMDHAPKNGPPKKNNKQEHQDDGRKPEKLHWYWTMYNIPAHITAVSSDRSVGILGSNSVNNIKGYAPPCSKGPGNKKYSFHLYALSDYLNIDISTKVTEELLRNKMHDLILDSTELSVNFERKSRPHPPKREERESQ